MQTPHEILQQYWHYTSFRPLQEEIIASVLAKKNVLAILPTGGGKSLCYQIPALILDGTCLVISPLIALMKDQALGLQKRGIACLAVTHNMTNDETRIVYEKVCSNKYKFLFVSPERLKSKLFIDYLQHWNINLIAVDEAHCISQWGYDFRPAYLEINLLKQHLPNVTTIALTASATTIVKQDILQKLHIEDASCFFSTFMRSNISLSNFVVENKIVKCIEIVKKINACTIIYCKNRRRTKELALTLYAQGINAGFYHAGLSNDERNKVQEDWIENKLQVIVCTNAFGMGIDKPDVRLVIHYDVPYIPESYYQEAGRAGRDGKKSYSVILFQPKNLVELNDSIIIKYPSADVLKNIYYDLCNYYQIFEGDENIFLSYDFNINDFTQKFKYEILQTLSAIQLLETQNYVQLSESVFLPSRVMISTSKENILALQTTHKSLAEVMKTLLRMYGGIWNNFVSINEFQMAVNAKMNYELIKLHLTELHQLQYIDYIPTKDKPQITFLQPRPSKFVFTINKLQLEELKIRYEKRIHFMIKYMQQTKQCRMFQLVSYFGETLENDCGICDVCLKNKKINYKHEWNEIKNTILQQLALHKQISIQEMYHNYSTLKKDIVTEVIRFLAEENEIQITNEKTLIKK